MRENKAEGEEKNREKGKNREGEREALGSSSASMCFILDPPTSLSLFLTVYVSRPPSLWCSLSDVWLPSLKIMTRLPVIFYFTARPRRGREGEEEEEGRREKKRREEEEKLEDGE